MRTTDAEVTVEGWATYYYIKCRVTDNVWSRNRWSAYGTSVVPDLFATERAAKRSRRRGKIAASVNQGFDPIVCSCLFGYESSGIKTLSNV